MPKSKHCPLKMPRESLYGYFGVGARLVFLRQVRQHLPLHGPGYTKDVIELFLRDLDKFPFMTTRVAAGELRQFYTKIQNKPRRHCLTRSEANELARITSELTPTFEAEAQRMLTVVLIEKRFEMGKLIAEVESLMAPGTFEAMPEIAQGDMAEAGKCIALDRATAAAFHCLRATEAMLRKVYFHYIKRNRLQNPMWHSMVEALRNKSRSRPSDELLDQLDILRRNFRNPTQHPEKVYDTEEAQDLFAGCTCTLNLMAKELAEKET